MSVEMAIWKMTDGGPQPLVFSQLGLEQKLENMIVQDPSLTGKDLLVVGRQVKFLQKLSMRYGYSRVYGYRYRASTVHA